MIGVLISNLGSPEGPSAEQVGPYLKEFLMDPQVIDIPFVFRWPLVNWLIIPKRKYASAELYKNIWTAKGSPLVLHTKDLTQKVAMRLGSQYKVEMGMRYGRPSLREALMNLKRAGANQVVVAPQYPQYALSSYESTREKVLEVAQELKMDRVDFVPAFYDKAEFLEASEQVMRQVLSSNKYDHLLFSFHGLPESHVKKTDPTKQHCLADQACCDRITQSNSNCYRAQSFWTARELAKRLNLKADFYSIGFQSRLSRRWIKPFSDDLLLALAARGVKRLAVACPSFTADCLETLEEVGIRFQDSFKKAGGQSLTLIPCVNSSDLWADGLTRLIQSASSSGT